MLQGQEINDIIKITSKKFYDEGDVKISTADNIKLDPNSYKKRTKVFDSDKQ